MVDNCYNSINKTYALTTYIPFILLKYNYTSREILEISKKNRVIAKNSQQYLNKIEKKLKKKLDYIYNVILGSDDTLASKSINDRIDTIMTYTKTLDNLITILDKPLKNKKSINSFKDSTNNNDINYVYDFLFSKLVKANLTNKFKKTNIDTMINNYVDLINKKISSINNYLSNEFNNIQLSWLENNIRVQKNIRDTVEYRDSLKIQIDQIQKLVSNDDDEEIIDKFIFIGYIPNENVKNILDNISKSRKILEKDREILAEFYGNNFDKYWGKIGVEYYTSINFLPYFVLENTTIFYVQRLIEIELGINKDNQYLWGYLNFNDSKKKKLELERLYYRLYDEKIGVTKDSIISFLKNNGLSSEYISEYIFNEEIQRNHLENEYNNKKITESEYKHLLENIEKQVYSFNDILSIETLVNVLSSYIQYQNLTFATYIDDNLKYGQWPYENPFYILLEDYDINSDSAILAKFSQLRENKKLSYTNDISNMILKDIGDLNSREIHLVDLGNLFSFHKIISSSTNNLGYMTKYIRQIYNRYYYNLETLDKLKTSITSSYKKNKNEIDALTYNNKILSLYLNSGNELLLPQDLQYNIECKSFVEIRLFNHQYPFEKVDLRDIFNKIILDDTVVFVRFYDEQRNENIYKIHKTSFGNHGLSYNILNRWLSRETFVLNLGKLTKTKETKKMLTYKLRLCNQKISNNKRKIKSKTLAISDDVIKRYNIYFIDESYDENVEEYLLDGDYVYEYAPIFLDFNFYSNKNVLDTRLILNPNGFSNKTIYIHFVKTVNKFIEMIKIIPYLKDFKFIDNDIIYNKYPLYNNIENLSSILNIKYKSTENFKITYRNLKNIINAFTPFVYIVEPFYTKDTKVKVYNKGRWIDGVVDQYDFDRDSYNISVKGDTLTNIRAQLIRLEGERGTGSYINMRYKRVSSFVQDSPLVEFIKRYTEWEIDIENIKNKMTANFNVSGDILEELNEKIKTAKSEIDNNKDRRVEVNGIDIKFYIDDNIDDDNNIIYTIEINHYRNIDDYYNICKLIDTIFRLYYYIYKYQDTNLLDQYNINIDDPKLLEKKQRELENMERQKKVEDKKTILEMGFVSMFDDDEEIEDNTTNIDIIEKDTGIIERAKREQIVESGVLDFEEDSVGKTNNIILERLYNADKKMFFWEGKNVKDKYTVKCQPNSRYPKVVGLQKFKYIMSKYKLGLGTTYIGNKDVIENTSNVKNEKYCDPISEIYDNDKCVSLKYGSQEEPQQWDKFYMCPKIWCARCNIPLHPRHLKNDTNIDNECKEFISKADIDPTELGKESLKQFLKTEGSIWRKCKTCNTDIAKHKIKCPECNGGIIDTRSRGNVIPTKTETLIILPNDDKNYIYPGLLNEDNHPLGINAVCCFNNANTRLEKKFSYKNNKLYFNTNTYIQGYGKELLAGRFGHMPTASSGFFNLDMNYFNQNNIRCENNGKEYCYRYGVLTESYNNCLSVLAFYLLIPDLETNKENLESYTKMMTNILVKKITGKKLLEFPILNYSFRNNLVSTLQNYIEFLISDDLKHDFCILQLLNKSLKWLDLSKIDNSVADSGVNIFILSINNDGKLIIETLHGYIQPYQLGIKTKSILLFRNKLINDVLEPIVYTQKTCNKSNGSTNNIILKFYEWNHPIIQKIINLVKNINTWEMTPKAIFKNREGNKYLEYIDTSNKTIDWLMNNWIDILHSKFNITNLVVDYNNMIIGILINNIILPLYPTIYDNHKYPKLYFIEYLELFTLPTYEEVLDFYNKINILPKTLSNLDKKLENDFRHFQLLKVIKSDKEYTGFYTIGGCIVPFAKSDTIGNLNISYLQLDYYSIEKSIINYRENYKFTPHLDYKKVLLDNNSYIYIIDNGYLLGLLVSVLSENLDNVYIPLSKTKWNETMPNLDKVSDSYTRYSFNETIEKYNKLYNVFNKKIPCRIVGIKMDNKKLITQVMLETGDYVDVEPTTKIYEKDENDKYLITNVLNMEIGDIFVDDITKYDKIHFDDRVQYITTMDYNKFSYERFRFEVARLLKISNKDKNDTYYKNIINLIKDRLTNLNQKRNILSNILVELTRGSIMYRETNINNINLTQKFIEQTCSIHTKRDQCSSDPFCQWLDYTKDIGFTEYKKNNYNKIRNQFIQYKNNTSDTNMIKYINSIKKYIELNGKTWVDLHTDNDMEQNIQNKLEIDYMRSGKCKLLLRNDEGLEFIHSKYIKKLVDDILRNPIKRREILENNIKIVDTKLSYNIYPNEILYTDADIKDNSNNIKSLYNLNRRSRLGILDHFTKNTSNFKLDLVENDEIMVRKLRDTSHNVKDISKLISFKILPPQKFVVDSIYNVKNVKIIDKNKALHKILKLNTPLTSYFVGTISKNIYFTITTKVQK